LQEEAVKTMKALIFRIIGIIEMGELPLQPVDY